MDILTVNLLFSTFVFWVAARIYVLPRLAGTVDLLAAIALATIYGAPSHMGSAYWIPAFWVPALLVTHYVTFVVLWKHWTGSAAHAPANAGRTVEG